MFFFFFLFSMFTPWDAPGERENRFEGDQTPPRIEIRVNECCGGMPPPPPPGGGDGG